MKKIGPLILLGLMTSLFSYAQENPYQDEQRMVEPPEEFPADEFYTPEEMTPEEQEEQKMIQGEEEWEQGEPLPSDNEELPFSPAEEYDSF